MFPYRVKYTESEYDIQDNGLLYKIHKQKTKYFQHFGKMENRNTEVNKCNFLFLNMHGFHNSYFVLFVNVVIWGFWIYRYIDIDIHICNNILELIPELFQKRAPELFPER